MMIVFWSVMFIADIFIIAYGLLNLFLLTEYLTGALALFYGIVDVYGNWWHISIGLDQFAGRIPVQRANQSATHVEGMPSPEDDSEDDAVEDLTQDGYQPKHSQSASNPTADAKTTLKKMFGLTGESKEQQLMELRRNSADAADLADGHPQVQDDGTDKLIADSVDNPLDQDAFADLPLNKKRELMGKHHQAESQASSESAADSHDAQSSSSDVLDSALNAVDADQSQAEPAQSQVKKGYDLNQIPTVRLAAMPSDRRKPGDAMPDDWIDDEETDEIIAQTKARMEADAAKSDQRNDSSDAKSEVSDEPSVDPDFDPNDDHQIEKMIARYDRERAEREAKQKKTADA